MGVVACRPASPAAAAPGATSSSPAEIGEYAPLGDGTVLAYETSAEPEGSTGIVVLQVRRPRPDLVELDDGGHVERLRVDRDGLSYDDGAYWLRAPLRPGNCWPGRTGRVCVTSVGDSVKVPAGSLRDCLTTTEESGNEPRTTRTRTVFCRGVGMALLEVEGWSGTEPIREQAMLRYAGPRVVLDVPPP